MSEWMTLLMTQERILQVLESEFDRNKLSSVLRKSLSRVSYSGCSRINTKYLELNQGLKFALKPYVVTAAYNPSTQETGRHVKSLRLTFAT